MFSSGFRRSGQILAISSVLIARVTVAQASPAAPSDPFAKLHSELVVAVDNALASALVDRPWMRSANRRRDVEADAAAERAHRVGAAMERIRQLRPLVEPILRAEGVPAELVAVAWVESGGQSLAVSPKGARGVWQFMPDTARRYGLAVSAERDDRVEIVKSTRAAARYLHDLYQQFGDWRLAFAAYNAGEVAVERAVAGSGQRDFASIERALPQETRNYVPAVLSAMAALGGNPDALFTTRDPSRSRRRGRLLYASARAE